MTSNTNNDHDLLANDHHLLVNDHDNDTDLLAIAEEPEEEFEEPEEPGEDPRDDVSGLAMSVHDNPGDAPPPLTQLERAASGTSQLSDYGMVSVNNAITGALVRQPASIARGVGGAAMATLRTVARVARVFTFRKNLVHAYDFKYDLDSAMFSEIIGSSDETIEKIVINTPPAIAELHQGIGLKQSAIRTSERQQAKMRIAAEGHLRKYHSLNLCSQALQNDIDRMDAACKTDWDSINMFEAKVSMSQDIKLGRLRLYANATPSQLLDAKGWNTQAAWDAATLPELSAFARELKRCKWSLSPHCRHKDFLTARRRIGGNFESVESFKAYLQAVVGFPVGSYAPIPPPTFAERVPPPQEPPALPSPKEASPEQQALDFLASSTGIPKEQAVLLLSQMRANPTGFQAFASMAVGKRQLPAVSEANSKEEDEDKEPPTKRLRGTKD